MRESSVIGRDKQARLAAADHSGMAVALSRSFP
jgi:hypothetical protein